MARKVIIDCDPGIDDAVALCLALFDPECEVLAVTATAGTVLAKQASRNVQSIVEHLDPPRLPRLGAATPAENAPVVEQSRVFHGDDGLGNLDLPISTLQHRHPSEKVICDELREDAESITLVCLGPLTNLARVLQRDPDLAAQVGGIVMMGGSVEGIGNVTPAAEFNMFYDPISARQVFRSPSTKTLVPLEVTRRIALTLDWADGLPQESTRAGKFLRHVVPYRFRAHRQLWGLESIDLNDAVALVAALHPEWFEFEEMAGDVETGGELTIGATVFDRRQHRVWRTNMEVAVDLNEAAVTDFITLGLQRAGRMT